ncbi:MAG: hypothetical protein R2771_08880 [Saprospiraceae bacterium]
MHPEVIILTDRKYNNWVSKLDKSWDGDIPATLIIKGETDNSYPYIFESENELNLYMLNSSDKCNIR